MTSPDMPAMDEKGLKNCPFCGGDELSHGYEWPPERGSVQCHQCDAYIVADTEAEAIAAWNRRAIAATARDGRMEPVRRIDMVSYEKGYKEPADPMWRVEVSGYCADFETELAATNFHNAIASLKASQEVEVVKAPAGWVLVPVKPTKAMALAAAQSHYGKHRVVSIEGMAMTVNDTDYSFWAAFRRFWKGALSATPQPALDAEGRKP